MTGGEALLHPEVQKLIAEKDTLVLKQTKDIIDLETKLGLEMIRTQVAHDEIERLRKKEEV